MSFEGFVKNTQSTADNLVDAGSVNPTLKRGKETIRLKVTSDKVYTRDTSTDTLWGLFNWGTPNWDGTYDNSLVEVYDIKANE